MKAKESKALVEVWEMKQAAYEETKHLKGSEYFDYIHEQIGEIKLPRAKLTGRKPKPLTNTIKSEPASV